jgi:hypothetical protein
MRFLQATTESIAPRLERARRDVTAAVAGASTAESAYQVALLDGENDLVCSRAQKAFDEARSKIAAAEERVRLLDEAHRSAFAREQNETRVNAIRDAEKLSALWLDGCAEIDKTALMLATLYVRQQELAQRFLETLPNRPDHVPDLLLLGGVQRYLAIRLMGLTDGKMPAPRTGLSAWEAAQFPPVAKRAAEAIETVMNEFARTSASRAA